jgi:HSP20 family protein
MPLPVRRSQDVRPQPIERWDPFRQLEQMQDEMERLMEGFSTPFAGGNGAVWAPVADIEETEDAWIIEAELPGVRREDINVELRDSELVISGEIKERERKGILRRRDQIEANLHDGVLTVRVPKPEQARPRRIEVKAD